MIYTGENKSVLYRGDFHPAQLYKGDKKIAGYELTEFESTGSVTLENCYNDTLYEAKITGGSVQEAPIQAKITIRGKNFVDKSNINIRPNSYRLYEKNGDLITVQGKDGTSQYAASAGTLILTFPESLPSGTYTFSMYVTLLEEGIWGTGMRILANNSKLFHYGENTIGLRKKITGTYTAENGFSSLVIRLNACKWLIDIGTLQVESGDKATNYEPFVEPQTESIYLAEESVTLPQLPTFKGTTIYEIDTSITTKISGKYKKRG